MIMVLLSRVQCWFYAANDVWTGEPYPHRARLQRVSFLSPRFERVIHVVRCPLKQISSFTSHLDKTYQFVFNHLWQECRGFQNGSLSPSQLQNGAALAVNVIDTNRFLLGLAMNFLSFTVSVSGIHNRNWIFYHLFVHYCLTKPSTNVWGVAPTLLPCGSRGDRCHLPFAAISWVYWNSKVERFVCRLSLTYTVFILCLIRAVML